MRTLTGFNTVGYIPLTWGKGKNSRKWKELIEKKHKAELGKFLRFSTARIDNTPYVFHVYEKACFMIEETSRTTGRVKFFGYGDFKGTKSLRWKGNEFGYSAKGGFYLYPLDSPSFASIKSVKQLLKAFPATYEGEDALYKVYPDKESLLKAIYFDSDVSDAVETLMEKEDSYYEAQAKKYNLDYELIAQSAGLNADSCIKDNQAESLIPKAWVDFYTASVEGLISDGYAPL